MFGSRGVVGDKWSQRILWFCALGNAISLYIVAVERRAQKRERMMAEGLRDMVDGACDKSGGGECLNWVAESRNFHPGFELGCTSYVVGQKSEKYAAF